MPRVIKKAKRRRHYLDRNYLLYLVIGQDFFRGGYADDMAQVELDWQHNKEEILSFMHHRNKEHRKRIRPWAWWKFDAPEPYRGGVPDDEGEALKALGMI